jgi:uncharacterized repeat protein (TIGR03803 family)
MDQLMRTQIKQVSFVCVWVALLSGQLSGGAMAQAFSLLHSFSVVTNQTNGDGAYPLAGLILSGNTLYGTAGNGGDFGFGAVFAVKTDGSGFTNVHSFAYDEGTGTQTSVILSSNVLYAAAVQGGSNGNGTLFAVHTDGTGFTNLHIFSTGPGSYPSVTNSDGALPVGTLVLSGDTLYGTSSYGGDSASGTIFKINTDGSDFTNLHSFSEGDSLDFYATNSGGSNPYGGLTLSGNTLYGTAQTGGAAGDGIVFAINTDGSGFTNLHTFMGYPSEGDVPQAALLLSGNTLYGTTFYGGSGGGGTVFAVNTDGTGFTNVYNFTGNTDGAEPIAGLILLYGKLFGTTLSGGSSNYGTVFAVNTDGTGFTNLHNFTGGSDSPPGNTDGAESEAGLILAGDTLFGTTVFGGGSDTGTVFSLFFAPQLSIAREGLYVILTWPTNANGFDYSGFALQSTTNLNLAAAWSAVSPAPIVIGGQNVVVNPISGAQMFYRLSQ